MAVSDQNVKNVNFSQKQREFIDWLATPKSTRDPINQELYAEKYGLTDVTLSRWKKLPGFMDAVKAKIDELAGEDDAEIINALKESCLILGIKGAQDRRTYLQWRGLLVEKQDVQLRIKKPSKPLEEMTDAELDEYEKQLRGAN